jgi:hypothetical protein
MSVFPVPPVVLIGREPRTRAEASVIRWVLLLTAGPDGSWHTRSGG